MLRHNPSYYRGFNALDPSLNIEWSLPVTVMSERDRNLPRYDELWLIIGKNGFFANLIRRLASENMPIGQLVSRNSSEVDFVAFEILLRKELLSIRSCNVLLENPVSAREITPLILSCTKF